MDQYMHYGRFRQRREREKGAEGLCKEIMGKSFSNLRKKMDIQIQEAQQNPTGMNSKKSTVKHLIIKVSKIKDNFESSKGKATHHIQGSS